MVLHLMHVMNICNWLTPHNLEGKFIRALIYTNQQKKTFKSRWHSMKKSGVGLACLDFWIACTMSGKIVPLDGLVNT
jgi:hypothetical protein